MLFIFVLDYSIRRVQVKQDGWKLSGTLQLSVYADYVNIFGGSLHAIKGNADASVVASTEIGLEVNADKTKYIIMPRDQIAGRSHGMKIDNSSCRMLYHSKHL